MENDKTSSETIPLSVIDENKPETTENVNAKESVPTSDKASNGGKVSTDVAGSLENEVPHVEKILTHHETFNVELPDYLINLPPESSNVTSPDKKEAASTDVPDGFDDYRNKKTLTQGMMDVALFSANISQLRSILDQMSASHSNNTYAGILIFMLVVSILLQVGVGLLLLLSTRYNLSSPEERRLVYKYGNYVVAGIFLVTVVNVFISAFGTSGDRYIPDNQYPKHEFTSTPSQ